MKTLILFFVMMISLTFSFAQKQMASCCNPVSATEQFAMLASNKTFVMSHDAPLPFVYQSANGNDITFKATDGTNAHGWLVKTDQLLFICDT